MPRIEVYVKDRIYADLVKLKQENKDKGFSNLANTIFGTYLYNDKIQEKAILGLNKVIEGLNLQIENLRLENRILRGEKNDKCKNNG